MSVDGHSQDYMSDISRDVKTIFFKGDNANHKITVSVLPEINETFRVSIPLYNEDAFFIILENKIVLLGIGFSSYRTSSPSGKELRQTIM